MVGLQQQLTVLKSAQRCVERPLKLVGLKRKTTSVFVSYLTASAYNGSVLYFTYIICALFIAENQFLVLYASLLLTKSV